MVIPAVVGGGAVIIGSAYALAPKEVKGRINDFIKNQVLTSPLIVAAIAWTANQNSDEDDEAECPKEEKDGQRGNPPTGEPNQWVEHPHGKQDRFYGPDGNPKVDIDYGHDHGQGKPHAHNWKDGVRENGVPVSILKDKK